VPEVVVVGGGPAGCAAAIFLAQAGHEVVLVDEARFPRDKVCGEGVSPEAWRLLARMGADAAVRGLRPRALHGMELTSPDGTSFRGDYRGAREPGFAVRRWCLDRALLECVRSAGVFVHEGLRARDVMMSEGRVRGVVVDTGAGPSHLSARLVVAADGRRSMVARRLGLLREHSRLRKFAVRGYWKGVQGLGSHGEMHVTRGGYCGIAPLGDDEANVTFVLDQREMGPAGGDLDGFYRRTLRRWPRISERLGRGSLMGPPRAIGPLALVARRVSAPGAVLVGDAAGFFDPFTGEGVTLALRGAELAAEVAHHALVRGSDDLRLYDRRRDQATRDKFRLNRLLQRVVAWPGLADTVARRLSRRPDLADRLVGIAGDFVPARTAFGPAFLLDLLRA
jgi:geranylgeranyl reductase family protein